MIEIYDIYPAARKPERPHEPEDLEEQVYVKQKTRLAIT